jgi:maltose O-acetyltransferase
MSWFPPYCGSRLRPAILRAAGFRIGAGTVFWGRPTIVGGQDLQKRLVIGADCWFNLNCYFDLGGDITIGDRVAVGQEVMILTNSHRVGDLNRRAGPLNASPVRVEDGAWLSTRCTILPGVTIGSGAVVAAGAVVNRSVPPNVMVGGVPARIIRELDDDCGKRVIEE